MNVKTYNVKGMYGKYTPVNTIMSEATLAEWMTYKGFVLESATEASVTINYPTCEGCERCTTDPYVPHYNCHCGANRAHCTSDYCY